MPRTTRPVSVSVGITLVALALASSACGVTSKRAKRAERASLDKPADDAAGFAPVSALELNVAARMIERCPRYGFPSDLRESALEGPTRLVVDVRRDGTVKDARVLDSSGSERMDNAAQRCLMLSTFTAAERDGVRVDSVVAYVMRFGLKYDRGPSDTTASGPPMNGVHRCRDARDKIACIVECRAGRQETCDREKITRDDASLAALRAACGPQHPEACWRVAIEDLRAGDATTVCATMSRLCSGLPAIACGWPSAIEGGAELAPVDPATISTPPRPIHHQAFDFPPYVARKSVSGELVMVVGIASNGNVRSVEIANGVHRDIDDAARVAMLCSRWKPALQHDAAVDSLVRLPIDVTFAPTSDDN